MKKFIAVAVDVGETVDGHSTCLGMFNTKDEAINFIREDMKDVAHSYGGCIVKDDEFEVWTDDSYTEGCVWDWYELDIDNNEII